jgi:hypothetical protein
MRSSKVVQKAVTKDKTLIVTNTLLVPSVHNGPGTAIVRSRFFTSLLTYLHFVELANKNNFRIQVIPNDHSESSLFYFILLYFVAHAKCAEVSKHVNGHVAKS